MPVIAVRVPPQALLAGVLFVMRMPAGRVSVKLIPEIPISVGEVSLILNLTLAPGAMGLV